MEERNDDGDSNYSEESDSENEEGRDSENSESNLTVHTNTNQENFSEAGVNEEGLRIGVGISQINIDRAGFDPEDPAPTPAEIRKRNKRKRRLELSNQYLYGYKSGNNLAINAKHYANHPNCERFVLLCVVLNTIILMMDYIGTDNVCYDSGPANGLCIRQAVEPSKAYMYFMDACNAAFLLIFTIEMFVKLVAYGLVGYMKSEMRILDGLTVIVGYIGFIAAGNSSLTAIRCLRLARIFRLTRAYPSMQIMINSVFKSMPSCAYFAIFFMLYTYLAAVGGMQLFGAKFRPPWLEGIPRSNYDNFFQGCLTTFQILTGENWNEIMFNGIIVKGYGAAVFFVIVFTVGESVVLNLFLSVVLCYYEGH